MLAPLVTITARIPSSADNPFDSNISNARIAWMFIIERLQPIPSIKNRNDPFFRVSWILFRNSLPLGLCSVCLLCSTAVESFFCSAFFGVLGMFHKVTSGIVFKDMPPSNRKVPLRLNRSANHVSRYGKNNPPTLGANESKDRHINLVCPSNSWVMI